MILTQWVWLLIGPEVERESREWLVECPSCGHSDNVWDKGGVRYKASGTNHTYGRCRGCGKRSMLKVHRPR